MSSNSMPFCNEAVSGHPCQKFEIFRDAPWGSLGTFSTQPLIEPLVLATLEDRRVGRLSRVSEAATYMEAKRQHTGGGGMGL
jgi:hypothetical protein